LRTYLARSLRLTALTVSFTASCRARSRSRAIISE
jgi:hypothetical protein